MYPNQFANSMKVDKSQPDWYKHIGGLGCMGHSWYLSVDFQLHMLTPWLLCLFRWRPKAGYLTMGAMILASLGYLLFLVLHANYNMCEAGVGAVRSGSHHFEGNENTLEYHSTELYRSLYSHHHVSAAVVQQHKYRKTHKNNGTQNDSYGIAYQETHSSEQIQQALDTLRSVPPGRDACLLPVAKIEQGGPPPSPEHDSSYLRVPTLLNESLHLAILIIVSRSYIP